MLHLLANSLRYGRPVGGLFVLVLVTMFLAVLLVPSLLQGLLAWEYFPGVLAIVTLAAISRVLLRRRHLPAPDPGQISTWPKLGQNDHRHVRSKLQKPSRIK